MTDIEELKKLAIAATPGPWHSPGLGEVHDDANDCVIVDVCWREKNEDGTPVDLDSSVGNGTQADADYIARANPKTVLAILAENERLKRENAVYRAQFEKDYNESDVQALMRIGAENTRLQSELTALRQELEREKIERETFQHGHRLLERQLEEARHDLERSVATSASLATELEEARKKAETFESSYHLSVHRLALMRRYVEPKMMGQLDEAWKVERRKVDESPDLHKNSVDETEDLHKPDPQCWCHHCNTIEHKMTHMILCPTCGNKRCPHANDHRNTCTGSNEPGQPGSAYPSARNQQG